MIPKSTNEFQTIMKTVGLLSCSPTVFSFVLRFDLFFSIHQPERADYPLQSGL